MSIWILIIILIAAFIFLIFCIAHTSSWGSREEEYRDYMRTRALKAKKP
jgi:hypothetical protein